MKQKIPTGVGVVILIIIAITAGVLVWKEYEMNPIAYEQPALQQAKAPVRKACPMIAKLCPDGSSVSATGPNCEFAACPAVPPAGAKPGAGK